MPVGPPLREPERVYLHDSVDKAATQGKDIILKCRACKAHEKRIPASELAALCTKHDWPRELNFIGEKLICSACGGNWPVIRVVQEGR